MRVGDLLAIFEGTEIQTEIPQRGDAKANGLGKLRWPVERTIAWLKQCRRIGTRRERSGFNYDSLVALACALICYKQLINYCATAIRDIAAADDMATALQ